MKNNKTIKIVLMLIIFLLICSIKTIVKADLVTIDENTSYSDIINYLNDDGISLNKLTAAKNKYIFCRDINSVFSEGNVNYEIDSSLRPYTHRNNAWSYMFGKMQNSENFNSYSIMKDSLLQKAFWVATGYTTNGYTNIPLLTANLSRLNVNQETQNKVLDLLNESNEYGAIVQNTNLSSSAFTSGNIIMPTELKEVNNAAQRYTYGPFYINCNSWIYNNELKAGISQFYVYYKDENENIVRPEYEIVYNCEDTTQYNKNWYGGTVNFTYTNFKDKMIELNGKMKDGFYIHFKHEVPKLIIKVRHTYINANSVTFTALKQIGSKGGNKSTGNDIYTCSAHEETQFIDGAGGTDTNVVYRINNKLYSYKDGNIGTTNWYLSTQVSGQKNDGNYHYYKFEQKGKYCTKCNTYDVTVTNDGKCSNCGETVLEGMLKDCYKYTVIKYTPWSCENNELCGTYPKRGTYTPASQELIIANSTFSTSSQWVETEPTNVETEIKLKLEKYESSGTTKVLNGATFNVVARQNKEPIFNETKSAGEIVTIPVDGGSRAPVYVAITEIKAPEGYTIINKTINIEFIYSETDGVYYAKFVPSNWAESGFESETNGEWQHLDSEDETVPNGWVHTYKSSANDTIKVEKTEVNPYIIKVYDNIKPIKLVLKKLGEYSAETRDYLSGAEFSVRAVQSSPEYSSGGGISISADYELLNIKTQTSSATGTLENVTADEVVEITPLTCDTTKNIYITIKETKAPAGYTKLSQPIYFVLKMNSNGKWNPAFVLRDEEDYDAFEIGAKSWLWVQTQSDEIKNDSGETIGYDSNLPNTYCVNPNNAESPVTEQYITENNITDVITVKYGKDTDEYIISVYNQPNYLEFNLEKNDIQDKPLTGAIFKVSVCQLNSAEDGYEWLLKNKQLEELKFNVEPINNKDISVFIEEYVAPSGYKKIKSIINLSYKYNETTQKWELNGTPSKDAAINSGLITEEEYDLGLANWNVTTEDENGKLMESSNHEIIRVLDKLITVYDEPVEAISQVKLLKTDLKGNIIEGAKFTGTISNILSFEDKNGNTYVSGTNNTYEFNNFELTSGELSLYNMVLADPTQPVVISLNEIKAPSGFQSIDGEVTIRIPYQNNLAATVTGGNQLVSVNTETYDNSKIVTITCKNSKSINISGMVWLDGTTKINNKLNGAANGIKEANENVMSGITVLLKNFSNNIIERTTTNAEGIYKFENIPYDGTGYYVDFEYDGLHYESTLHNVVEGSNLVSIASEAPYSRKNINKQFYTIHMGENGIEAIHKNGLNLTSLDYVSVRDENTGMYVSRLNCQNPLSGVLYSKYAITARSNLITESTENVNLGLVERGIDLAATVNVVNKNNSKVRNYTKNNTVFANSLSKDSATIVTDENKNYVTYRVDLINQSMDEALVNEIAFYYDSKLTLNEDKTLALNKDLENLNVKITDHASTHKIDIEALNGVNLKGNTTRDIYLVFEVSTDDNNKTFTNAAEITSYSTEKGLIDVDSAPGNLDYSPINGDGIFEDDSFKSEKVLLIK